MHTFLDYKSGLRHVTRRVRSDRAHGEIPYLGGTYGLAACGLNVMTTVAGDNSHDDATCADCVAATAP